VNNPIVTFLMLPLHSRLGFNLVLLSVGENAHGYMLEQLSLLRE